MIHRLLALTLALAALAAQCVAAEPEGEKAPQLPVSPPPQFAMVSEILKEEGRVAIQYSTTVPVTEMVTVERDVNGQAVAEQIPRMVYRVEIRTNEAALSDLMFFGVVERNCQQKRRCRNYALDVCCCGWPTQDRRRQSSGKSSPKTC
jgi:hypothetical protein